MFIPPSSVSGKLKAEIAIVGAGPAGMALSLDLARRGMDVVLLSSGTLAPDKVSHELSRATEFPENHVDPSSLQARRFGGMSWSWGGRCVVLEPIDVRARPELDLPGWPIQYEELCRHADDAARFLGIGQPEFLDQEHPEISGMPVTLERWAPDPAIHEIHADAFSADTGPRTYLGLTCTGAEINHDGRMTSLTARKPSGETVTVEASTFVLATGGIETARLLLWFFSSNDRLPPKWTGRGYMGHLSGQVIKMESANEALPLLDYYRGPHCFLRRRLHLPEDQVRHRKLPSISFWLDNPAIADPSHGLPGLSLAYLALSAPGIGARLMPKPMRDHMTAQRGQPKRWLHAGNVLQDPVSAFRFCFNIWRDRRRTPARPGSIDRRVGTKLGLSFSAEERPRLQNRIELTEETDRFSVPRIAIFRSPDPVDVNRVIRANHLMVQQLQAAGFAEATLLADDSTLHDMIVETSGDGFHQIGTARMGANAGQSVTDQDCRVHGTKNLYIAGSAVFPRSGQANPTFSVICLALRLAKHLRTRA